VNPSGTTSLAIGQTLGVSVSYTAGNTPGSGTATLSAVNASNGQSFGSAAANVTVNGVSRFDVMAGTSNPINVGQSGSTAFTVTNNGTAAATMSASLSACSGAINGCSVSPSTAPLEIGQSTTVTVGYLGGSTPGTGSTTLVVIDANTGGSQNSASTSVTVNGIPNATVAAGSSTALYVGQSGSTSFTITNNGSATASVTPTLTSCGGAIGSTCSLSPSGTTSIGVGQSLAVTVSYVAGSTAGTGTATLAAVNASNGQTFSSASASVAVSYPPVSISATPSPSSINLVAGSHQTVSYSVLNNGSYPAYLTVTQKQCDLGTCGTLQNGLSNPLGVGQTGTVSFDYGATTGGNGNVALSFVNAQSGTALSAAAVPVAVQAQQITATLTPQNGSATVSPNQTGSWPFTLTNTGNVTRTITLAAVECSGGLVSTSCVPTPNTVTLAGGNATATINVAYQASAFGSATSGYVRVNATDQATGTLLSQGVMSVNVPPPPIGGVAINLTNGNPGTTLERSACLALPAGKDGDNECGDLRVTHVLPATTTLAKPRAPALIYNSQAAQPMPQVFVDVTLPADQYTTQSVSATLIDRDNSTTLTTGNWSVNGWAAGTTRRVMLSFDGSTYATKIYHYRVDVTRSTTLGTSTTTSDTGSFALVKRGSTMFPAGWWLAGLEQLYTQTQTDNTILWVGGDGSTRQYVPAPGGCSSTLVFTASTYTRPDTLLKDCASGEYTRKLPNGATVTFDAAGRQRAVTNRHNQSTTYTWNNDQLSTISLPVLSGTAPQYSFQYGTTQGPLQAITAPPIGSQARITNIGVTSNRLLNITDPDGSVESFGYDAGGRINDHTDRRGFHSHYDYSSGSTAGNKLTRAASLISASDSAVWSYTPKELIAASGTAPVLPESTYSTFDGPRTDSADVSRFWLDRFGAPTRIVNALAQTIQLTRADSRFPGAVTDVVSANGFETRATYDTKGHLQTSTQVNPFNDGQNAVTTYSWDMKWDRVTRIVPPANDSIVKEYDANNGDQLSQQDARGAVSKVTFQYTPAGQLAWIIQPGDAPGRSQHLEYDTGLSNLLRTTTPMGFVTTHLTDAIGRDTLVSTPIDSAQQQHQYQRTVYSTAGRDSISTSWAPRSDNPAQIDSLSVRKLFDREGGLTEVRKWTFPDPTSIGYSTTTYDYDGLGRQLHEYAPSGSGSSDVTSTSYDRAGNVTETVTRRGYHLTMGYDRLNRLSQRVIPQVVEADTVINPGVLLHYPLNNNGAGLTLPQDVQTFGYDAAGNMITANNREARITRSYLPGGALLADTSRVRAWSDTGFTHVYGLQFKYDIGGRRTKLVHPGLLAPHQYGVVKDTTRYQYGVDGSVSTITDPLGDVFTYHYDARARLDSLTSAGRVAQRWFFDEDDRVARQVLRPFSYLGINDKGTSTDTAQDTRFHYDALGKAIAVHAYTDSVENAYDGMGPLSRSLRQPLPLNATNVNLLYEDLSTSDAMGRIVSRSENEPESGVLRGWNYQYQSSTGRLLAMQQQNSQVSDGDNTTFDRSGNTRLLQRVQSVYSKYGMERVVSEETMNYYGADERLRIIDRRTNAPVDTVPSSYRGAYEEFRYDALGRRVATLSKRDSSTLGTAYFYIPPIIERYVWDGDQLLYETHYISETDPDTATIWTKNKCGGTRGTGGCGGTDATPGTPSDTTYDAFSGRVAYTHGSGIDQPLSIIRVGYGRDSLLFEPFAVIPFANWRGSYERGFTSDGGDQWIETHYTADGTGYQSTPLQMSSLPWAAPAERAFHGHTPGRAGEPQLWFGSLIKGQEGQSQLLFRRNRFYDPIRGQFTQEDPIGLSGGLNLYGFGAGDPVNYSDPFGLCPWTECLAQALADWGARRGGTTGTVAVNAGAALNAGMEAVGLNMAADAGDRIGHGDLVSGGAMALAATLPVGKILKVSSPLVRGAAEALAARIGENSVTVALESGFKRVDLIGKAHAGVPTPHVHIFEVHMNPETGATNLKKVFGGAASRQDVIDAARAAGQMP
jgi:RHS repeat-associated protein